ncbi:BTB/POZ protein [Rhizophagus irregularis DAOM 181602=DAOM 197198]|nr:BTB/POZ protein [Rhizophagus irregularis DAOM 181602=DAOM 197198]
MDEYNFLQELSNDLGELFSSGNNCDVIIQAEENDNKKEFYTHSLILCSRSTYFKAALSKNWIHNENGMIIFKKPNISPEIMNHLLKYLYSGIIELDKQRGVNVFKLFIASDELEDPIDILQIIFKYEHFNSLRNNCLEFISENPKIFFESTKFLSIEKSILIKLIQRDDLEIHDEYEIWNYILKWDIITKNFKYFSLKPRKSIYCNSKIITKFHLPIFSSWIDYKEKNFYNIKTMPYHFELLYRANDDFDKSFTDDDDEPIIARLANKNYDKYLYNSNYGPTFGTGFDLIIENDIIKCDNITSYPKLLAFINPRQIYFLEDYEVYKVTK